MAVAYANLARDARVSASTLRGVANSFTLAADVTFTGEAVASILRETAAGMLEIVGVQDADD